MRGGYLAHRAGVPFTPPLEWTRGSERGRGNRPRIICVRFCRLNPFGKVP